jgi:hypothetical protein
VQARWPRARRKSRRDAGNSRGAGARSQAVGSRSRSYASSSFSAASRKTDCRTAELARSESRCRWRGGRWALKRSLASGRAQRSRGKPVCRRLYGSACTSTRSSETVCEARSVPSNVRNTSSILSGAARHQVGVAETLRRYARAHRTHGTMEGVLGRPSILSRRRARESHSPAGEDGGAILVRRVNPSSCSRDSCTRRQLSVGLEPMRWCPRTTWDVRGRDDFGEGSSSCRKVRRGAGGQHPERREALPCRMLGRGSRVRHGGLRGQRVHRSRIGRSGRKRIAALTFTGSGRANGSGPARALTPNEGSR